MRLKKLQPNPIKNRNAIQLPTESYVGDKQLEPVKEQELVMGLEFPADVFWKEDYYGESIGYVLNSSSPFKPMNNYIQAGNLDFTIPEQSEYDGYIYYFDQAGRTIFKERIMKKLYDILQLIKYTYNKALDESGLRDKIDANFICTIDIIKSKMPMLINPGFYKNLKEIKDNFEMVDKLLNITTMGFASIIYNSFTPISGIDNNNNRITDDELRIAMEIVNNISLLSVDFLLKMIKETILDEGFIDLIKY